jgi:subtilisin-like proprotein convertase family protein
VLAHNKNSLNQPSDYLKNFSFSWKTNPNWLLLILFLLIVRINAQEVWTQVQAPGGNVLSSQQLGKAYYILNTGSIQSTQKVDISGEEHQLMVLPNEKGQMETFSISKLGLLSKALSERFPNINTYEGRSRSRPNVRVRLSTHPNGINAWLKLVDGPDFFIQTQKGQKNLHFTYLKSKTDETLSLSCKTQDAVELKSKVKTLDSQSKRSNNIIKTFRIAIATTAEYTSFWGDNDDSNGTNVEDAFGAVVSSLNRISSVFEDEVKVRLELVSDERLFYEDAETDPFTGNFASELQSTLDEVLGDEAYDVGHLFDYGQPNGDAGCIGCVCESGKKGKGFSSHPFRDVFGGEYRNDYFDLDYAGHEIGHQFGAFHSFSFDAEGTGFNAEPGSGSTIMGYAGITGEDDIQLHGDPYFHYHSIQNILDVVATTTCAQNETIDAPVFITHAGDDYYIPIGTPYELKAQQLESQMGTTYCWEQLDSGQITSDNFGPYNATGSMARSLPPSLDSYRMIPNQERLITNSLTQENPGVDDAWETVPLVARTMEWGLTVRKPFENSIQLAQDRVTVTVDAASGPFEVTSLNEEGIVLKGGGREKIYWNVANTNQAPINATEVMILLSTDGGLTFTETLGSNLPNSGSAEVFIPNDINTSQGRIKIKAVEGIFFAINQIDFSIEARDIVIQYDAYLKENCTSDFVRFDFTIERKNGFTQSFIPQIEGLPSGVQVQFSKSSYSASDNSGYFILRGLSGVSPSDLSLFFGVQLANKTETFLFVLKQRNQNIDPTVLSNPINQAIDQSINLQFDWEINANVDSSRLQVALNENFNSFVKDTLLTKNQFLLKNLLPNTRYYWRVQGQNGCSEAPFSEVFSFNTSEVSCMDTTSVALPKTLNDATDNQVGVTTASLEISYDLPILDLDVLVDIEHTWVGDLVLYLESPDGSLYLLSSEIGESDNNYTQTLFDQEATVNIFEAEAPFTGSFKPLQDISSLYGTSSRGTWQLIVEDRFQEDSGRLLDFTLELCVLGVPMANSDNDSVVDEYDNCPFMTNENQADIDENGIGDVCDIFSSQNISIAKRNTSCPENENGVLTFDARAEYVYTASIIGSNGFQRELIFTPQGKILGNLAAGNYSICVRTDSFLDFEYCFETEISSPPLLEVSAVLDPSSSVLDLDISGAEQFNVIINGQTKTYTSGEKIQIELTQKTNFVKVISELLCQGVFEEWIHLGNTAQIFPNPVANEATLLLPENRKANLRLYTGAGEMIWERADTAGENEVILIPMNRFKQGWYLLRIDYDTYSETLKILKK